LDLETIGKRVFSAADPPNKAISAKAVLVQGNLFYQHPLQAILLPFPVMSTNQDKGGLKIITREPFYGRQRALLK